MVVVPLHGFATNDHRGDPQKQLRNQGSWTLSDTQQADEVLGTPVGENGAPYNPWMSRGAPTETRGSRSRSAQAVVVALLIVGLLTAIFIFQNTARTRVRFLFWSTTAPLSGALILATVLGGILAFLVVFVRQRKITRDSIAARDEESRQGKSTDGELS